VPGTREIPNYEPPDEGWSIVIGPFMRKPEPKQKPEPDAEVPADDTTE
jgi:hypothetical protein